MVFRVIQENKLIGFTYYPLIEIILGVFFLFVAFFVPLLFFKYNGFKIQQWDEWLFLLFFFLIFLLLGKNLAYQNMKVEIRNNTIRFQHDMREPNVNIELNLSEWNGVTSDVIAAKDEPEYSINIKKDNELINFYKTINNKENKQIIELLNNIYSDNIKSFQSDKGDDNGTK